MNRKRTSPKAGLRPRARGPHPNPGGDGRIYFVAAEAEGEPGDVNEPLYKWLNSDRFDDVLDLEECSLVFITAQESAENATERYRWWVEEETEATLASEPEAYTADDLGIPEQEILSFALNNIDKKSYVGGGS